MAFNFGNKTRLIEIYIITILFIFSFTSQTSEAATIWTKASTETTEMLREEVEKIYTIRSKALVGGDPTPLLPLYDTSLQKGQWALQHEVKRVKYLHDWSKQRGMRFTDITSTVRIKRVIPQGAITKIALEETYKFDYIYPEDANPVTNSFGVGIRHTLSLTKKNNQWAVYSDWFTDCFEDALASYSGNIGVGTKSPKLPEIALTVPVMKMATGRYYNREKAIAYADKYCGAAWGSGNNYKYNRKYKDFTGIGGDCTNFISQVLGDKEEGAGLPFGHGWHCIYSKRGPASPSAAWVNADKFKNHLLYSGKGSVIAKGTFIQLTTPSAGTGVKVVDRLQLADLVCYEKGVGNIDHFAMVTARDSHGYPLVNSHTTDRYHVPWDLGWGDKKIRFFIIHING